MYTFAMIEIFLQVIDDPSGNSFIENPYLLLCCNIIKFAYSGIILYMCNELANALDICL